MLGVHTPIATVAVKDLAASRRFYVETLGLTLTSEDEETLTFKAGQAQLFVYRSAYAGTNQATSVTWSVGASLVSVVETLRARHVAFEHYDLPGAKRDGDLHDFGDLKVAWFKDPDGNIHSLMSV